MANIENIRLTSMEQGVLWTTYINDTMARCVLTHFLNTVEDAEIKPVVEYALSVTELHIHKLTTLFHAEKFAVPKGFSDNDVHVNAKRLFSDAFYLNYIKNMSKVGLAAYAMSFTQTERADIRAFFSKALDEIRKLDQMATQVLQSKGLYVRSPYISVPENVDFVENQNYLSGGFFGFGEKRPLTAIEIAHLFMNIQTNALGKVLIMGFSQVAQSEEIRKYFIRGKEISIKHIRKFSDFLLQDDIPAPITWDSDVMNSTEPPFSDKLILFHICTLISVGTGNYGLATAASLRRDVVLNYVNLAAEVALYAEDGANLLIKNGWLEEPPQAPDRNKLAKV